MKQKVSAGLAIVYDHRILLVHPTNASWYNSYGIPKGGVEEGETYLDAAIRETREETGINIPKSLIDKTEHYFSLSSKKYKYNKTVYYYVVKIDDLSQIGLKDLVIPKRQLQLKEVDWAGFLSMSEINKRVAPSQATLINNLIGKGLLENKTNILKFKDF
jgi:ADP-ribose pyrophosphatase YjhB (NUDIX family)